MSEGEPTSGTEPTGGGEPAGDGHPTSDGGVSEESAWSRWDGLRERESFVAVATVVFVLLFPFVFTNLPVLGAYWALSEIILIWAIFAIGFDLLLGYTGLLSFGHAAFWGGSAYAAGLFSFHLYGEPVVTVVVGALFAVLLAAIIGFLSLRRGGIYFAILTLAFGQMFYFMALSPLEPITRGEDGFTSVQLEPLLGLIELRTAFPGVVGAFLHDVEYLFYAAFFVLAVVAAHRILKSPYGTIFKAIRENERRANFVGLNVWRYKFMSFIISGAFAGVAGSLITIHANYVALDSLWWTVSGDIVIITVLGGVGTLFGPILGAALFLYVENVLDAVIGSYWLLVLGLMFVAVVWLFPRGLWGALDDLRELIRRTVGGDRR
jgi:branched-chain amino acid transport system permease protein